MADASHFFAFMKVCHEQSLFMCHVSSSWMPHLFIFSAMIGVQYISLKTAYAELWLLPLCVNQTK